MKILTKEEEQEHYRATVIGGVGGGFAGLALGAAGVYAAGVRYPAFRQLTLPLRAFLITSAGTFSAIVSADHYSRAYEKSRHPDEGFQDESARARAEAYSRRSTYEKAMQFGKEQRYKIVGGSWVASMGIALGLVGRNPYLTTAQKLVQARVYAQGLTVAVLVATAVFEIGDRNNEEGRYEIVQVLDPNDPTHKHLIDKKIHKEEYRGEDQWKDMVESEERKMQEREREAHEQTLRDEKAGKVKHHKKQQEEHQKKNKEEPDKGKSARG
ncbi:MAG: hypothetical protein Q9195_005192 [Heterodermia aff. obscurata]